MRYSPPYARGPLVMRACNTCGVPCTGKWCPAHDRQPEGEWAGGSTRAWRKVRAAVLERDGHVCQLRLTCQGARATHVDHRVPKSKGGTDDPSNLRAACAYCNLARGAGEATEAQGGQGITRISQGRTAAWLEDGVEIFAGAAPAAELPAVDDDQEDEDTTIAGGGSPSEEPAQLPAAPKPPPPAPDAPIRPSAPRVPVSAGDRDLRGKVLSMLIKANRPVAFAEIHTAVGGSIPPLRKVLQQLVRDEHVTAEGATKARRYQVVVSESAAKRAAGAERNAARVQDGVDRVVFRDKVAKAIAADPGLTIDQLALGLDADRDDITEACDWLVEHHRAELDGTGGYVRATPRRARLRAAA